MAFDFQKQLKLGHAGEELFQLKGPWAVERLGGRKADFLRLDDSALLELKSDGYDFSKTPNMFIEWLSNEEKKSPGGPWQALTHGTQVWAYQYTSHERLFTFEDLPKLIQELELILPTLKPTGVLNRTYRTIGYKVPRHLLASLYDEYTYPEEIFS